jgi:hypothetical protein
VESGSSGRPPSLLSETSIIAMADEDITYNKCEQLLTINNNIIDAPRPASAPAGAGAGPRVACEVSAKFELNQAKTRHHYGRPLHGYNLRELDECNPHNVHETEKHQLFQNRTHEQTGVVRIAHDSPNSPAPHSPRPNSPLHSSPQPSTTHSNPAGKIARKSQSKRPGPCALGAVLRCRAPETPHPDCNALTNDHAIFGPLACRATPTPLEAFLKDEDSKARGCTCSNANQWASCFVGVLAGSSKQPRAREGAASSPPRHTSEGFAPQLARDRTSQAEYAQYSPRPNSPRQSSPQLRTPHSNPAGMTARESLSKRPEPCALGAMLWCRAPKAPHPDCTALINEHAIFEPLACRATPTPVETSLKDEDNRARGGTCSSVDLLEQMVVLGPGADTPGACILAAEPGKQQQKDQVETINWASCSVDALAGTNKQPRAVEGAASSHRTWRHTRYCMLTHQPTSRMGTQAPTTDTPMPARTSLLAAASDTASHHSTLRAPASQPCTPHRPQGSAPCCTAGMHAQPDHRTHHHAGHPAYFVMPLSFLLRHLSLTSCIHQLSVEQLTIRLYQNCYFSSIFQPLLRLFSTMFAMMCSMYTTSSLGMAQRPFVAWHSLDLDALQGYAVVRKLEKRARQKQVGHKLNGTTRAYCLMHDCHQNERLTNRLGVQRMSPRYVVEPLASLSDMDITTPMIPLSMLEKGGSCRRNLSPGPSRTDSHGRQMADRRTSPRCVCGTLLLILLARAGDVEPNPGPMISEQHIAALEPTMSSKKNYTA